MVGLTYLSMFTCMSFATMTGSNIWLWNMGEVLTLLSVYLLMKSSSYFPRSFILQYMFIMFGGSLLIILGFIWNIEILTITGILVKLTIFPFHKPTYLFLSVGAEVVIIFLLMLPKVPYLIFSAYLNPLTIVLLTVLGILMMSNNNSKENLAYSMVVSTCSLCIVMCNSLLTGVILFILTCLWSVSVVYGKGVYSTSKYLSGCSVYMLFLLPLPGSYSMILKIFIAGMSYWHMFMVMLVFMLFMFPFYFTIKYLVSTFPNGSNFGNGSFFSADLMYVVGISIMMILTV
uniref:NADH dehydrogenase subunit 2 n=1 Tax=Ihlea magalhanica TaxID=2781116 RepID=A0AA86IJQ4_9UROC|nr:NADH dehydrogenase subunit 2 [Ihlea magalhanica]